MAFDTIDQIQFIRIDGQPQSKQQTFSEVTREAEDGRAYRKEGKRADEFTLKALADRASSQAVYDAVATWQANEVGKIVSFTRNGTAFLNYLVKKVELLSVKQFYNSTGGVVVNPNSQGWIAETAWTLVYGGP